MLGSSMYVPDTQTPSPVPVSSSPSLPSPYCAAPPSGTVAVVCTTVFRLQRHHHPEAPPLEAALPETPPVLPTHAFQFTILLVQVVVMDSPGAARLSCRPG